MSDDRSARAGDSGQTPPAAWRLVLSALVVVGGVVYGLVGLIEREWVRAVLGALLGLGQLPLFIVLLRQRQRASQPAPTERL